jgi:site-specific DNA-methyltransferase (adenine-specific)
LSFNTNTLYYGDNLEILRHLVPNESVDLIYLDPPFNSKADYNILFKEKSGEQSSAQIQAFSDFWEWNIEAKHIYDYLTLDPPNETVAKLIQSVYDFLGKSDTMAYLVMMAVRLLELNRVLKSTGSIFLHCDTTASHYLKLLMDSIFGVMNFKNEIVWKRTSAHSGKVLKFGRVHDVILFYTKSNDDYKFNAQFKPYAENYIEKRAKLENDGRRHIDFDLTGAGVNMANRENLGMV